MENSRLPTLARIEETQRSKRLWLLASSLVSNARMRNRRRKAPFDLTPDWVHKRLLAGVCEASGIPFELTDIGAKHPFQPSLDQISPGRGDTTNNVRVTCLIYNYAKSTFRHEDVVRFATEFQSRYADVILP